MKLEKRHLDALEVLNLTPFTCKWEVQPQQDSLIKHYLSMSLLTMEAEIRMQEIIAAANLLLKEVFI